MHTPDLVPVLSFVPCLLERLKTFLLSLICLAAAVSVAWSEAHPTEQTLQAAVLSNGINITGRSDVQRLRWQDVQLTPQTGDGSRGVIEARSLALSEAGMKLLDALLPFARLRCVALPHGSSSLIASDVALVADPDAIGTASVWQESIEAQEIKLSVRRMSETTGEGCLVTTQLSVKRMSVLAADGSRMTLDRVTINAILPIRTDAVATFSLEFENLRLYGRFGTRVLEITQGSLNLYSSHRAVAIWHRSPWILPTSGKTVARANLSGITRLEDRDSLGSATLNFVIVGSAINLDSTLDFPGLLQLSTAASLEAASASGLDLWSFLNNMTVDQAYISFRDEGLTLSLEDMGLRGLSELVLDYGIALSDSRPYIIQVALRQMAEAISQFLREAESTAVAATFDPKGPVPLLSMIAAIIKD